MTHRRRTQQERRAETERRVLDAAMRLILERGVRAVTLAAVGQEAGYSRGIVTHQFGTRQALMDALVRTVQAKFAPVPPGLRGLDRILAQVDAYLTALDAQHGDARVFLMLWAEAIVAEPGLRATFAERDEHFRARIVDSLREGLEDGTIHSGVDPEATAVAVVGQLRGIGLQLVLAPRDVGPIRDAVVASLRRSLER